MMLPIMPNTLSRLGLLSLVCLLWSCQTFENGDKQLYDQSNRLLKESLDQSRAKVAPPASVQAALIPPLSLGGPVSGGPRFDVAATDMPAREFFLSLMEGAGKNIVVHPQVSGNITFSLRNVTLEEVLAAVRDSYGYDFSRTEYGYQILPNQAITRTYELDYLNLLRSGQTDTQISSGQVTNTDSTDNSVGGSTTTSTSTNIPASQLTTSSEVDYWKQIQGVVQMIIGDEKDNSVAVNPQAGLLVVRASSADQMAVESFLKLAQRNLERQVILETKILEVRLNDGFQAGVDWAALGSDGGVGVSGDALTGPNNVGGVFSAVLNIGDFTGALQLLETQGEIRVLSSPRVSTLNNQKAVIKVGVDEYFVTDVSTPTTSLVGGTTAPDLDITLTPFFSGISLDVTPQINRLNDVTLHVRPSVSLVKDQNKTIELGGPDNIFNLPLAQSRSRQSDSIVRAHSGQVVVIGGLMQNNNEELDAEVPWLSKLPVLGWMFQQQRKDLEKSELVILLRPLVVNTDTWIEEIQKSAETFKELR